MTIPVQITFRHMESSTAVETRVRELAGHLGVFSDKITSCRVVLDSPHRHSHQGKVFNVKVQLALPGEDVVVDMERPQRDGHEDVYVGASPRGSLALFRTAQARAAVLGRDYIVPDDIKTLAVPTLAHRLIVGSAARVRDVDTRAIVQEVLRSLPVPGSELGR